MRRERLERIDRGGVSEKEKEGKKKKNAGRESREREITT